MPSPGHLAPAHLNGATLRSGGEGRVPREAKRRHITLGSHGDAYTVPSTDKQLDPATADMVPLQALESDGPSRWIAWFTTGGSRTP